MQEFGDQIHWLSALYDFGVGTVLVCHVYETKYPEIMDLLLELLILLGIIDENSGL